MWLHSLHFTVWAQFCVFDLFALRTLLSTMYGHSLCWSPPLPCIPCIPCVSLHGSTPPCTSIFCLSLCRFPTPYFYIHRISLCFLHGSQKQCTYIPCFPCIPCISLHFLLWVPTSMYLHSLHGLNSLWMTFFHWGHCISLCGSHSLCGWPFYT